MKHRFVFLIAVMLLMLCACSATSTSIPTDNSNESQTKVPDNSSSEVQYEYQLKAGKTVEVNDMTFDEMVTVTVDPISTRDASNVLRSNIYFENCTFNKGLTIVGDYHAMISFASDCSFPDNSVVTCKEATSGAAQETTLDDNLIKLFVSCKNVTVESESAVGVLTDGPEINFNGTAYRKKDLAPDADFLGVYGIYENGEMSYIKLAIGEDDSVEFLG